VNIPHLIAHRGYAKAFPENTLLSLDAAVQAGARWVEFDVQLTADAVPVVLHDETFVRTAGREGSILETYAADLDHICVNEAARFGPNFPEVRISSLETVVLWLKGLPQVIAFVEIKRASLYRFGIREAVVAVLRVLESVKTQCVLVSFEAQVVPLAREVSGIATGWVLSEWDAATLANAVEIKPNYVFCNRTLIPPGWKDFSHYPWHWAIYEVTEVEEALEYAASGVAFIETMAIGEMLQHPVLLAAGDLQSKLAAVGEIPAVFESQPLG
jgi:glycerophosphoryl diester phosphodiesterase